MPRGNDFKVEEALRGVSLFKNIPKAQEKAQIRLAMERANITQYAGRKVGQLSGGMLRRLGIAQAILGEPALLIMDEPTAGLDPAERIHFRKLVRDYMDGERIILISSHIVPLSQGGMRESVRAMISVPRRESVWGMMKRLRRDLRIPPSAFANWLCDFGPDPL